MLRLGNRPFIQSTAKKPGRGKVADKGANPATPAAIPCYNALRQKLCLGFLAEWRRDFSVNCRTIGNSLPGNHYSPHNLYMLRGRGAFVHCKQVRWTKIRSPFRERETCLGPIPQYARYLPNALPPVQRLYNADKAARNQTAWCWVRENHR